MPAEGSYVLFIVKGGRALKKNVRLLAENSSEAVIEGDGLRSGDLAATIGTYELKDNMRTVEESGR